MTAVLQVRSTFPDLDAWNTRTSAGFRPTPGSALALDDEDWMPWRLSQLSFGALSAAQDNLEAFRVLVEARRGFALGMNTLLRGALLGGAQAVWLLSPNDRATRLDFGRCAAAEM